jgi:hypothetical protein
MTHTDWNTATPGQQPGQPAWQPPQPEAAPKSRAKKVMAIGGPIVGAAVVGVASLTGFFGVSDPEVGDCVKQSGAESWDVVDCGSDEAQYKVVGQDEKQLTYPEFQSSSDICSSFATAEYSLWIGPDGNLGTVYCAEPL